MAKKYIYDYHQVPEQLLNWDRLHLIPEFAFNLASKQLSRKQPVSKEYLFGIAKNAELSLNWAKKIQQRFPKGEPKIAKHHGSALGYALHVIKGPWPPGEAAIAKHPMSAVIYADSVLSQRFPEAESMIASMANSACLYARFVIKGAWPPGEPAIARDPQIAFNYAKYVLGNQRFPLGEPKIAQFPFLVMEYCRSVLKGPWPEGEAALLRAPAPTYAVRYAIDLLKRPWPEAEPFIAKYGSLPSKVYCEYFPERAQHIAALADDV